MVVVVVRVESEVCIVGRFRGKGQVCSLGASNFAVR